ncbi:hypothetical protein HPB47_001967 [Ixodes persulcatus]|uniref:Uncharacterized protein n=1 Tax=Ixodes persulcatus TaxID=34615 RepID=A0AC60PNT0_IXOPE|nr:hypothetical protein HPB47_001967 [Ixodes persulcatus]
MKDLRQRYPKDRILVTEDFNAHHSDCGSSRVDQRGLRVQEAAELTHLGLTNDLHFLTRHQRLECQLDIIPDLTWRSYTDAIFLFVHSAFKPDVQGEQVSPNEIQEVPYAHPTLVLESNIAVGIDALFQRSQNSFLWHVVEQVLNILREARDGTRVFQELNHFFRVPYQKRVVHQQ